MLTVDKKAGVAALIAEKLDFETRNITEKKRDIS